MSDTDSDKFLETNPKPYEVEQYLIKTGYKMLFRFCARIVLGG